MLNDDFHIIDLSKPIYSDMQVYPGDPSVKVEVVHEIDTHGWLLRALNLGSHTGTHVDAFSHMDRNGADLDSIELSHFVGYAVRVGDINELPSGVGLIFDCEMTDELYDRVMKIKPAFVGASMDERFERAFLIGGVTTFTTLVNVEALPVDEKFLFIGLPLKIREGDGSPVRAVALINK